MKDTQLIEYAGEMAKRIKGKGGANNYHNTEIALVMEELRKQLLAQAEESKNLTGTR